MEPRSPPSADESSPRLGFGVSAYSSGKGRELLRHGREPRERSPLRVESPVPDELVAPGSGIGVAGSCQPDCRGITGKYFLSAAGQTLESHV